MYGGGHEQFTRIDTRSTNGSSSKNSLVNSMQSGQSTQSMGQQENAWSLTARIRSRGDAGPDPEYQVFLYCRDLVASIFTTALRLAGSSSSSLSFSSSPLRLIAASARQESPMAH